MPGRSSQLRGVGAIHSALRCRGDSLRSTVPGQDHPSPLCDAGTRSSLSALRYQDQIIPLRSPVRGDPIPLHSAVPGRPSLFTLRCRRDPLSSAVSGRSSQLCGAGAILSAPHSGEDRPGTAEWRGMGSSRTAERRWMDLPRHHRAERIAPAPQS